MSFRTRGRGSGRKVYPIGGSGPRVRNSSSRSSSMSGKLPSSGIKHEGELTKHGYQLDEGEDKRHQALVKAVHEDGYATTQQRLTAIQVVNKGHPSKHAEIKADQQWLREHAYTREPSKDTAGGSAFVNKAGSRTSYDGPPEGGFRVWKE